MKNIFTLLFALLISSLGFGQEKIYDINMDSANSKTTVSLSSDISPAERNNELIFIKLRASTSNDSYSTDVYFNPNATLGFDLGYDASLFGAIPEFVLFTELVEGNTGLPLALQAVNSTDLSSVSIPLGVSAYQGQELTFSIANSTLPASINVYLDDTVANSSTLLNTTDYVLTPASALSGSGRFFLRTSIPSVTYTYTDGVWAPTDPMGVATIVDEIIVASGDLVLTSDLSVNNVIVNPGASLNVNSGVTLSTADGLVFESSSTAYSSLIRNGIIIGSLSYERHVNINGSGSTGSNDLVSAPFTGQPFNAFASANPNILSNNDNTLFLFGPFEKNTGSYVTWSNTETATLDPGVGYRAGSEDNGTFTFTGTDNIGNISIDIMNSGTNNEEWNLVGNPYPSYLNVQQFLLHDVGGVANFQLFDAPTAAIYGYDGNATNGWTIYNLATTTPSTLIAPGQGFFVSADATNADIYDLQFTPLMRSSGTSDDFILGRNSELVYLKLKANTNLDAFTTEVYFNNNASSGLDLGYDAKLFGNIPSFAMYSHLIQDNNGDAFALQTLHSSAYSNITIPLGLNANQGEQITFSISDTTLPSNINVYLDDTVENTSTLLNNFDYVISPTNAISGTGRFFLRTTENALSATEYNLDKLNVFVLNNTKELVINGTLEKNSILSLYDIQGRLVFSSLLDHTLTQNRIGVSSLSKGVYVINIQNNSQQKSQKVIIN